jgi:hypothetical protein
MAVHFFSKPPGTMVSLSSSSAVCPCMEMVVRVRPASSSLSRKGSRRSIMALVARAMRVNPSCLARATDSTIQG